MLKSHWISAIAMTVVVLVIAVGFWQHRQAEQARQEAVRVEQKAIYDTQEKLLKIADEQGRHDPNIQAAQKRLKEKAAAQKKAAAQGER